MIAHGEEVSQSARNSRLFHLIFTSDKWLRTGRNRLALPFREGEVADLIAVLKTLAVTQVITEDFILNWSRKAWVFAGMVACNAMFGYERPLEKGGWNKTARDAITAIGGAVDRLLRHGLVKETVDLEIGQQMKKRRVNYQGEEMGTCHKLTLAQILPSLPPASHGGCIPAVDFVSAHTKDLLLHPGKSILEDDGRPLPKLKGIIHVEPGETEGIARELVNRGICSWVPLSSVVRYRGEPVLNGMFGVEKGAKLEDQRPVLRLIMNLVSSNSIMRQFTGAVRNLPSITAWMSTVLLGDEEIRIWQSDMCNAFYLFRIPSAWSYYLAFNILQEHLDTSSGENIVMALACNVLPMGWLSSVAIMQEISERILHTRGLDLASQLVRNRPLPAWMVGLVDMAKKEDRSWWHVYLDNFAAGQIVSAEQQGLSGGMLHEMAEHAWQTAGVLSSEKKRKSAIREAEELGAFIDGAGQYLGGSPTRFLKLLHGTLWMIDQPLLSKKIVQILAGRWIHVMQFRRPTMSFLDKTWTFIGRKGYQQGIHQQVRREFFLCLLSIPLMHCNLGANIAEQITASDASSTGGAVGLSKALSNIGKSFVRASLHNQLQTGQIPVLVISLFGGIGGAFRAYDLLGVRPVGLIHFDIHEPANRIVSRRWPQAEIFEDVKTLDKRLIRDILARYLDIAEIHLWGGFPCTDLSSARANRQGLLGPASSLFFEIKRIRKEIREEIGESLALKLIIENVASMNPEEAAVISQHLGLEPYFLDCADAIPMHRPRLCWTTEVIEGTFDDVSVTQQNRWRRVEAKARFPPTESWIEPNCSWPGGEEGYFLPTAMKSIPRDRPPVRPAGINKCSWETLERYREDGYRYPPYQYQGQYMFYTAEGNWRTIGAEEKELLMGFGWKHTAICYSASKIKQSYRRYDDERQSLLGDSFNMYSFVIPAAAACRQFLTRVSYQHVTERMGLAPGFRCSIRTKAPLKRALQYGFEGSPATSVGDLNRLLISRTNHTGSDVRISTGEVLNPRAHPRQGVEASWWQWEPVFRVRWKHCEHINLLELRSIFLSLKFLTTHQNCINMRVCHITDSYVCMSILGKGRTGSKQLAAILKKVNALLLAHGLQLILGHVESTQNPTDGASRAMEVRWQENP